MDSYSRTLARMRLRFSSVRPARVSERSTGFLASNSRKKSTGHRVGEGNGIGGRPTKLVPKRFVTAVESVWPPQQRVVTTRIAQKMPGRRKVIAARLIIAGQRRGKQ